MITIKELEKIQEEFNSQNVRTFEKLDEMLNGLLSNANCQSATDEGTPEGIEESYYYLDAIDEDGKESTITSLVKYNAELETEYNNYDDEFGVSHENSYKVPVNPDKWTIESIDLVYNVR